MSLYQLHASFSLSDLLRAGSLGTWNWWWKGQPLVKWGSIRYLSEMPICYFGGNPGGLLLLYAYGSSLRHSLHLHFAKMISPCGSPLFFMALCSLWWWLLSIPSLWDLDFADHQPAICHPLSFYPTVLWEDLSLYPGSLIHCFITVHSFSF